MEPVLETATLEVDADVLRDFIRCVFLLLNPIKEELEPGRGLDRHEAVVVLVPVRISITFQRFCVGLGVSGGRGLNLENFSIFVVFFVNDLAADLCFGRVLLEEEVVEV